MKNKIVLLLCAMLILLVLPLNVAADPSYVDIDVEGYQISAVPYTVDGRSGEHFSLRLVAKHSNIDDYNRFGYQFKISYKQGENTVTKTGKTPMTNKVYRSIFANGETISARDEFGCDYISAVVITDIPVSCGDLTVTVTPIIVYSGGKSQMQGEETTFTVSLDQYYTGETVSTMTFNMYHHDTDTAHVERVQNVIRKYTPDVIGFQEITQTWIDERIMEKYEILGNYIGGNDISKKYGYVATARGDNTKEQAAIFYRKDKFTLKDSGTRWLYGEDGSVGSDSVGGLINKVEDLTSSGGKIYYRIYTYAILERISDGKQMVFVNTHLELDHFTSALYPNPGDVKNKQIDYILNFAKQMQDQGYPVVIMGDFNARVGEVVCNKILNASFVRAEAATTKVEGAEVNSASQNTEVYRDVKNSKDMKVNYGIDHIFVLADKCYFDTYRICNEKFADSKDALGYASDHLPRIAVFAIG